ncbi:unnamed protein product [Pieris macdunnoughi]|uniref:Reverse transcriptase domain-containing protein n=1 Tax=Pieris macdunnoughi TaxID=345717 RepID=A0A821TH24_9NEOP|nr:unnamed protein product [Pieris macdunnoughi]
MNLRLLHWNAAGLRGKGHHLRHILRTQDVDVALISETHLRSTDRLSAAGYFVYREENQAINGAPIRGLAVQIRRRIPHRAIQATNLTGILTLGVELELGGQPTDVLAIYAPPGHNFIPAELEATLSQRPTILAGDWNAKHISWHSHSNSPRGTRLLQYAETRGYTVCGPEDATHYPRIDTHRPDIIDLVVHNRPGLHLAQEVLMDEFQSDHQPVLCIVAGAPSPPARTCRVTDWNAFESIVGDTPAPGPPDMTPGAVDDMAESMTRQLQAALAEATTTRPPEVIRPDLAPHVQRLIQQKRALRRQWQRNRCPVLKTQLNRLAERVKAELATHARRTWEHSLGEATTEPTRLFQLCRRLYRTPEPKRPLYDSNGVITYNDTDRAEIFAEHLQRQFSPNTATSLARVAEVESAVEARLTSPIPPDEAQIFFSPSQVRKTIRRLPLKKAPGPDGITHQALRHLPMRWIVALARLFTGILRTLHFPKTWKEGKVILIPKPGKDSTRPESYRPITLLSTQSKLFERLLLQRIQIYLQPRPEQFGFRGEHSTTLQLTKVLFTAATALNKKNAAAAVMLDMEKAFDRVWHDGLVLKLAESPLPRRIVAVLRAFLTDRTFFVATGEAASRPRPITAGVPQGSVLSPILYATYTDDVPCPEGCTLALYADDTAYVATSLKIKHAAVKLQRALDLLPEWLEKWRLAANPNKTQAIAFGQSKLPPPLRFLDQDVPWKTPVTYLGVTIDRRLTMRHHVNRAVGRAKGATYALYPLLYGNIPLRNQARALQTVRAPTPNVRGTGVVLLHKGDPPPETARRTKHQFTTRSGGPRYVRNATIARDLRMESIDEFVARLTKGMFDRADASQHPHLKDIAPWHSRPPDKYRYPRELFSADTPTTGRDTRAATAATTAGRLAGPPRGHRGSHPAELDREPRSCPTPTT